METIYTVDYFIKKFEAIPEEKWCAGKLIDGNRACAFGHCDPYRGANCVEGEYLHSIMSAHAPCIFEGVAGINDGLSPRYIQSTPKQRILAALYDIKKLNREPEVKECDATQVEKSVEVGNIKTITKYVSVPESIKEKQEELILN